MPNQSFLHRFFNEIKGRKTWEQVIQLTQTTVRRSRLNPNQFWVFSWSIGLRVAHFGPEWIWLVSKYLNFFLVWCWRKSENNLVFDRIFWAASAVFTLCTVRFLLQSRNPKSRATQHTGWVDSGRPRGDSMRLSWNENDCPSVATRVSRGWTVDRIATEDADRSTGGARARTRTRTRTRAGTGTGRRTRTPSRTRTVAGRKTGRWHWEPTVARSTPRAPAPAAASAPAPAPTRSPTPTRATAPTATAAAPAPRTVVPRASPAPSTAAGRRWPVRVDGRRWSRSMVRHRSLASTANPAERVQQQQKEISSGQPIHQWRDEMWITERACRDWCGCLPVHVHGF